MHKVRYSMVRSSRHAGGASSTPIVECRNQIWTWVKHRGQNICTLVNIPMLGQNGRHAGVLIRVDAQLQNYVDQIDGLECSIAGVSSPSWKNLIIVLQSCPIMSQGGFIIKFCTVVIMICCLAPSGSARRIWRVWKSGFRDCFPK